MITFDPSPNYSSRGPNPPQFVIIHATAGTFEGTIATFKNKYSRVSAHFVIDRDGAIVQMVDIKDAAWAAMHWPNMVGLQIEHVDRYMVGGQLTRGCMGDPQWFTHEQLNASADLVAQLMQEFKIPIEKVIGHNDPWLRQFGNNHQDPGPYWPWHNYKLLLMQRLQSQPILESAPVQEAAEQAPEPVDKPRPGRRK